MHEETEGDEDAANDEVEGSMRKQRVLKVMRKKWSKEMLTKMITHPLNI